MAYDKALQRLFAEIDAAVAAFDPTRSSFWMDCRVELRQALEAASLDLDLDEALAAWRQHYEPSLKDRERMRKWRLEAIRREWDALLAVPKHQRTDEQNRRIYELSLILAEAHATTREYHGPLATWGDAGD